MIETALKLVESNLNSSLKSLDKDYEVCIADLGTFGRTNVPERLQERILLYCNSIEEESAIRMQSRQKLDNGVHNIERPPISLNIYVIVAANYYLYSKCLRVLGEVSEVLRDSAVLELNKEEEMIRITIENYNVSMEQDAQIWSSIGCNKYPYQMYKLRVFQA